jgi:hypothetical protein
VSNDLRETTLLPTSRRSKLQDNYAWRKSCRERSTKCNKEERSMHMYSFASHIQTLTVQSTLIGRPTEVQPACIRENVYSLNWQWFFATPITLLIILKDFSQKQTQILASPESTNAEIS